MVFQLARGINCEPFRLVDRAVSLSNYQEKRELTPIDLHPIRRICCRFWEPLIVARVKHNCPDKARIPILFLGNQRLLLSFIDFRPIIFAP